MNVTTIDSLNAEFFNSTDQQNFYYQKAKDFYNSFLYELKFKPQSILALHRSWLSEYLLSNKEPVIYPNQISSATQKFDLIIALDEVLTRDIDEAAQKKHITQIVNMLAPQGVLLASLRDFRNTNCHRRPLGDTCYNQIGNDTVVSVEVNQLHTKDKQSWNQKLHVVVNDEKFYCIDSGPRRTLYFKQLARYCADANVHQFGVIKDLYWKSHLRRSLEHVVFARAI